MSEIIKTDADGVNELCQKIQLELSSYNSLRLINFYLYTDTDVAPCQNALEEPLKETLGKWEELVVTDVEALQQVHANFKAVDQDAVMQILGVGAQ